MARFSSALATCRAKPETYLGSAWGPVILPVFKTGARRLRDVVGAFDSHTLPPGSFPSRRSGSGFRLRAPAALTPAERLNFKTGARRLRDVVGAFDSHTLPPGSFSFAALRVRISPAGSRCAHARRAAQLQSRRAASSRRRGCVRLAHASAKRPAMAAGKLALRAVRRFRGVHGWARLPLSRFVGRTGYGCGQVSCIEVSGGRISNSERQH